MTNTTSEVISSLTSNQTVSGNTEQEQLIGQAATVVDVTVPNVGETSTIVLGKGQTVNLNFDASGATPVIEGNNFVLTFDNNGDGSSDSRIVFENLVDASQGADAPVLIIGGVELSAGLLIGQAQALSAGETLETAAGAGAGPQGGGGSQYDDETGNLVDLLDAQDTLGRTELNFNLLDDGDEETLAELLNGVPVNNGAAPVNVEVHEDALKGANAESGQDQTTEITITSEALATTIDAGTDGLGGFDFNENISGPVGLTSQGEAVSYKVITDGSGIAVQGVAGSGDGERVVFELTKDGDDFNFALKDQIDHTPNDPANDDGQSLDLDISGAFKAFDANGDEVVLETAVTVTIEDDVPVAVDDTKTLAGTGTNTTVTDNVLYNDGVGADGGSVTSVTFGDVKHDVVAGKETKIVGDHGTLQISADGKYTYTAFSPDKTNLIKNGSFENGHGLGDGKWKTFTEIEGWTNGDGGKFEIQNSSRKIGKLKADDGTAKVELDGHGSDSNATIQQVVDGTNEGQTYQLTFSYSPRPGAASGSSDMQVFWNGELVKKIDSTEHQDGWESITIDITGTGNNDTVLSFTGTGAADTRGAYIDDVSLKASDIGGTDKFTYEVTDGDGDTTSSTLSLTVDGANADYSTASAGIKAFLDYDGGPVGGANAPTGGKNNAEIKGKVGLSKELVSDDSLEGVDNLIATDFGDYVYGSAADNEVSLGSGDDTFDDRQNGSGNDIVDGGADNDKMWTGDGEDTLIGGTGDDILFGESGDDLLIGGAGDDTLNGGSGADTYQFSGADAGGTDTIVGFNVKQSDVLDLSELLTGNELLAAIEDGDNSELARVLDDYLDMKVNGSDTTITIDSNGKEEGGDSVTIELDNVNLLSGSTSELDAIKSLLDLDSLNVDIL
ncbi:type I secretion C-terminal target domain-containing protein [uncultured Kiloniella sp.]|uniref:type I secretion C-terminal target domain-containing protein n=1 Tax=uncultured Kiloniella sp. TaxID=1133091 RepID=UPI002612E843|nr:type I secretion C-terminal target domain-containing protein [uncultured Kiloniella sp.]